ncbi:hypothetical protein BRADI_5g02322v3 [Brachypodium distachyon]|uniref:KIB1-4 beta-propeller domain-containing protein n=1 Tax=Brachypodium distachyon TaxID=15368 RepID=A0A0Q3H0Y6_BRADI|nr:hypothetical protein BRADI_5g02322v3 [Brachypodium distachyon]
MAPPPWSDLPPELLGLVIDRLLSPSSVDDRGHWLRLLQLHILLPLSSSARHAHFRELCRSGHSPSLDRARFRAVCRSWKSAVTEHASAVPPRQTPWIVLADGSFLTLNGVQPLYRLPSFPQNARCIGSTDGWLALDSVDANNNAHAYSLHNPFSAATVPLRELDAVIGKVSRLFQVRKVLMRSTPDDVVALVTNNWNYPVILVRPGKGVWLPKPRTAQYVYIIDVAFLGDKLYGVTQHRPHPPMDYKFYVWSSDDEDDDEDENEDGHNDDDEFEDYYIVSQMDDKCAVHELMISTRDDMIHEPLHYWHVEAGYWWDRRSDTRRFSKSIPAHKEEESDVIYFIDTGDVYNMRTHTMSPSLRNIDHLYSTWIFSLEIVV